MHANTNSARRWIALVALAAVPALVPAAAVAQAMNTPDAAAVGVAPHSARLGPYIFLTGGRTNYDVDCFFWTYCDRANGRAVKFGGGYRFGAFGVEAWGADLGRGTIEYGGIATPQTLRMRAVGVSAVWTANFGPAANGYLRVGGADVSHQRTGDTTTHGWQPTFGLGLSFSFTPQVALQLDWDVTRAEGANYGTTLGSFVTAGVRVRF